MMNSDARKKAGLVLSGGGAFGAYEVGVINTLYGGRSPANGHTALDAAVFAGTSVGSFNAAVLAMNIDGAAASARRLNDIWLNAVADKGDGRGNGVYRFRGDVAEYVDPRVSGSSAEKLSRLLADADMLGGLAVRSAERFIKGRGSAVGRLAGLVDISVLLDTEPFANLVKSHVSPAVLRESSKVLSATATNWANGEPEDFNFRRMTDDQTWEAIRASAAIPGLFPAVTMAGQIFLDGGVVMNTPTLPAIEEGATELHVISLNPGVRDLQRTYTGSTLDILNHVYTSMVAANVSEDIESARWVNEGVEVLERLAGDNPPDFDSADGRRFVRVANMIWKKLEAEGELPARLTIHHYHPTSTLGGVLGMLNFDRAEIERMIAMGEADARTHDCDKNNCLIA